MATAGNTGWTTTFSTSITTDNGGWSGYNLRQVINSTLLSASGSKVRVTLLASSAGGFVLDQAEIGHQAGAGDPYDFDGSQVPMKFSGGSAGVTVASAGSVLSDEITYAFDKTKNFIVAVHFSATSATKTRTLSGAQGYYRLAAGEVATANVSGYTTAAQNHYLVSLIEVM